MRFETPRVLKTIEELEASADGGPGVESRLADVLAEGFRSIGWYCERNEVAGSEFPELVAPWLGWIGVSILMTMGCVLALSGRGTVISRLPWVLAILWYAFTARFGFRFGWKIPPWGKAFVLVARRSGEAPASDALRVVIQTPLGPMLPARPRDRWWRSSRLIGLLLVAPWLFAIRGIETMPVWLRFTAQLALAWLWVACIAQAAFAFRAGRTRPQLSRSDLAGPACLLELARVWPASRANQFELVLVAAGGQRLDFAGARAVAEMLQSQWPPKPTLLILLFGPGIGEKQLIISRNHHALGEQAAAGLWIPHETIKKAKALSSPWPLARRLDDHLAIVGSDCLTDPAAEISPDSLRRAAELAMEIALRWAKTSKTPPPPKAKS
jgi:hypothetical protein